MPVDPDTLRALARQYAQGMTSIRGRRVQRLIRREFAGAEVVLLAPLISLGQAVLGVSAIGAAICATDGTGKRASVVKWVHGAALACEVNFDLHKDSLPLLGERVSPLAGLLLRSGLKLRSVAVLQGADPRVFKALKVLA